MMEPVDWVYSACAGFATWAIYLFDRIVVIWPALLSKQPDRKAHANLMTAPLTPADDEGMTGWLKRNRRAAYTMMLSSALAASICFLFLPRAVQFYLLHLGVLSFFYSVPLPGLGRSLRSIRYMKLFLIAYVWAAITATGPALYTDRLLSWDVLVLSVARGLFVLALTLPFDMRDMATDKAIRLRTIPHVLGYERSWLLAFALLPLLMLLRLGFMPERPVEITLAVALSLLLTVIILLRLRANSSPLYYAFFVDGALLAQGILLILAGSRLGLL